MNDYNQGLRIYGWNIDVEVFGDGLESRGIIVP